MLMHVSVYIWFIIITFFNLMLQFSPDDTSQELRLSFQSELGELIMNIIRMLSLDEDNNTHLNSQGRKNNNL